MFSNTLQIVTQYKYENGYLAHSNCSCNYLNLFII